MSPLLTVLAVVYIVGAVLIGWVAESVVRDTEELAGVPKGAVTSAAVVCGLFWPLVIVAAVALAVAGRKEAS